MSAGVVTAAAIGAFVVVGKPGTSSFSSLCSTPLITDSSATAVLDGSPSSDNASGNVALEVVEVNVIVLLSSAKLVLLVANEVLELVAQLHEDVSAGPLTMTNDSAKTPAKTLAALVECVASVVVDGAIHTGDGEHEAIVYVVGLQAS